jgi:hypothetical protein
MSCRQRFVGSFRLAVFGIATTGSLLAGCSELPVNEQVRQHCANVPAAERQSCEDAEYARIYAQERYQNRRIAYP